VISTLITSVSFQFANIPAFAIVLPQSTQNNESLQFYPDLTYSFAQAINDLSIFVAALSLLLFFGGYLGGKLIAIECLAVVQLSGLLLLTQDNMPPTIAALKPLTVSMGLTPLIQGFVYEDSSISPNFKYVLLNRNVLSCVNIFLLLFVVPVIGAIVVKIVADTKYPGRLFPQYIWKNTLGTFSFYGLLFLAYSTFAYLVVDIYHFQGESADYFGIIVGTTFVAIIAVYIVAFFKVGRWLGSFTKKFSKFSVSEYLYVFSTIERLITSAIIVLLSPSGLAPAVASIVFIL
jgi:hypothetical protein